MTAVSVVIAGRDAEATIGRTLAALRAQDFAGGWEALVVDDGSTDATAAIVERAAAGDPRIRVVEGAREGAAQARNRGAAEAQGQALAFTDADCFPAPAWLSAGVDALADAQLVQGAVRPEPDAPAGPFDRTLWVSAEIGLYETANLFVDRAAFERAGGFEDWLRPAGRPMGEDAWLGWRLRRGGARSRFCAEALVHHAVFERSARDYVAERLRLAQFPRMVARIPELRRTLCYRHVFLSPRTAAFDGAVASAVLAAARRSPLPLVAALPYAAVSMRRAARFRSSAPRAMAVDGVADAVGLVSLVRGSLGSRSVLL